MATKLAKSTYPNGLSPQDFKTYGPVAEKDTEFSGCKMADFGCFNQENKGVDSNKFYVVQCCTDPQGKWYVYVEYGRQGVGKPQFQFIQCSSEAEAQKEFVAKCQEKNTKRGEWTTVAGMKMFTPKAGKDLYSVRKLAKRTHGLPDGQSLTTEAAISTTKKVTKVSAYRCDNQTTKLMRDLLGGAVTYTRSSLQGGTIPSQQAIDEARDMLTLAKQRLVKVGGDLQSQINDRDLKQITYALYSRVPKIKPLHSAESAWILSQDNIFTWEQDLDAFESALSAGSIEEIAHDDPMRDMPVDMSWIDPNSELGQWLANWWTNSTKNRHANVGKLHVKNMWTVQRHAEPKRFQNALTEVEKCKSDIIDRPDNADKKRYDLSTEDRKKYWNANVGLMFHGSRSVNIASIVRNGLFLPKNLTPGIVVTGRMYGDGKYWASDWKKSAGYTSLSGAYWASGGGKVKGYEAFMFAADVILGKTHVAKGAHGYMSAPNGCHSVLGKAGVSGVANDEWITYKEQDQLKYLIEFGHNK